MPKGKKNSLIRDGDKDEKWGGIIWLLIYMKKYNYLQSHNDFTQTDILLAIFKTLKYVIPKF